MTRPETKNSASGLPISAVFPVVLPVPPDKQRLRGRSQVRYLSERARRAAGLSAEKTGVAPMDFTKSDDGAPQPQSGMYWSVSHKREYVAGVVSCYPIGIDIEKIRPCSDGLIARVAAPSEWNLSSEDPSIRFFRFWTAKEAVVKAEGVGFAGFPSCRIHSVDSDRLLTVRYFLKMYRVNQVFFHGHIAAVVCGEQEIDWEVFSGEDLEDSVNRG